MHFPAQSAQLPTAEDRVRGVSIGQH
jgi:hypothetical protein